MNNIYWKDFKIGDLFEKIETKKLRGKANDFPIKSEGKFIIPLLTAGIQNQGLSRYAKKEQCPMILRNVLTVSANGANSGVVFYQPNDFAVLQDAYAIKLVNREIQNEAEGIFLAGSLGKAITGNYSWVDKAGWNKIKDKFLSLPVVKRLVPDFDKLLSVVDKWTVGGYSI